MNRNGMVATLDAVIFVAVLAMVSVTLVTVDLPEHDSTPDASEVIDTVSYIRLSSELIAENSGDMNMSVWDMCAASMNCGETGFVEGYLEDVVGDVLTDRYAFEMTVSYGGTGISFGEGAGAPLSQCTREMGILGGGIMTVSLTIYG